MILSVNDVPIPPHCLRNKFQLGCYCLALCLLGETAPSVLHFILYVIFMGTLLFFLIMFWRSLPQAGVYNLPPLLQQMLNNWGERRSRGSFRCRKIFTVFSIDTTASASEALLFLLELPKGPRSPESACVLCITVYHNSCPISLDWRGYQRRWSESTWPCVTVCIHFMQTSSHWHPFSLLSDLLSYVPFSIVLPFKILLYSGRVGSVFFPNDCPWQTPRYKQWKMDSYWGLPEMCFDTQTLAARYLVFLLPCK